MEIGAERRGFDEVVERSRNHCVQKLTLVELQHLVLLRHCYSLKSSNLTCVLDAVCRCTVTMHPLLWETLGNAAIHRSVCLSHATKW